MGHVFADVTLLNSVDVSLQHSNAELLQFLDYWTQFRQNGTLVPSV